MKDTPHYYLFAIATKEDCRGKGYGTSLITPILERSDQEGMCCYLEITDLNNRKFYERFGFETKQAFKLDDGKVVIEL